METRTYMSGSQKRKMKKERDESIKKLSKLDSFFIKTQSEAAGISSEAPRLDPAEQMIAEHATIPEQTSDFGAYVGKTLSDDDKRLILSLPSNRPQGPFPKDPLQNNRSFSDNYYNVPTKYGCISRLWLCYSKLIDAAYCEPCWLFSDLQNSWTTGGMRDWKHFSTRITEHSQTRNHMEACAVLEQWKKNKVMDGALEEKIRYEASFGEMILERLFKITLLLAKNWLPFCGHSDNLQGEYNAHFLSQVKCLAEYDDIVKQIVEMPAGSVSYLSPKVQNEIIECLSQKLRSELTARIHSSPFFSLLLDTTQDITKKDQLSIVIRTAKVTHNEEMIPIDFEVKETFLGFYQLADQSAEGMANEVLAVLDHLNISIQKCYGQGYDGASVMSGLYDGLQTKIKTIQSNAEYVHCATHNLNLVVNDVIRGSSEISRFFDTLQSIYSFFGLSIERWDILASFTSESEATLKKLDPSRWSGRISSISAVKLHFFDILKLLTKIHLESTKTSERNEALAITNQMAKYEFVFITVLMFRVLTEINFATKVLQKKDIDLNESMTVLSQVQNNIQQLRGSFEEMKLEAGELAKKWQIDQNFKVKHQRIRIVKKHYDEMARDHRFENAEERFKVKVFFYVIDQVTGEIEKRFTGMKVVHDHFDFLDPKIITSTDREVLIKKCTQFSNKYSEIIEPSIVLEYQHLLTLVEKDLTSSRMSTKEFFALIIKQYGILESDFIQMYMAFLLFLTLPVTVASIERSFSKLKMIKNYLRSQTGQNSLNNLALLSIESKTASEMDLTQVIKEFANAKARERDF